MSVLRAIHEEKYVRLTTFTRDGRNKHIPVWIALISDNCIGFTTVQNSWKVKRILHTSSVELIASDYSGNPLKDAKAVLGNARIVDGEEYREVVKAISSKYGWQYKMIALANRLRHFFRNGNLSSDCAIIVTFDKS